MIKVGTVIKFEQNLNNVIIGNDVTPDKHYTIVALDSDGEPFFIDDVGDPNWSATEYTGHYTPTIVSE